MHSVLGRKIQPSHFSLYLQVMNDDSYPLIPGLVDEKSASPRGLRSQLSTPELFLAIFSHKRAQCVLEDPEELRKNSNLYYSVNEWVRGRIIVFMVGQRQSFVCLQVCICPSCLSLADSVRCKFGAAYKQLVSFHIPMFIPGTYYFCRS